MGFGRMRVRLSGGDGCAVRPSVRPSLRRCLIRPVSSAPLSLLLHVPQIPPFLPLPPSSFSVLFPFFPPFLWVIDVGQLAAAQRVLRRRTPAEWPPTSRPPTHKSFASLPFDFFCLGRRGVGRRYRRMTKKALGRLARVLPSFPPFLLQKAEERRVEEESDTIGRPRTSEEDCFFLESTSQE